MLTLQERSKLKRFTNFNLNRFRNILQPKEYILGQGKSINETFVIRYLQNRIRSALFFFINGCFWLEGYFDTKDLLFPVGSAPERIITNIFLELQPIVNQLSSTFGYFNKFNTELKRKINNPVLTFEELASLFAQFYDEFEEICSVLEIKKIEKKIKCEKFGLNQYPKNDLNFLYPLRHLEEYANKYLKKYLTGFYLHGSLSTIDYIPYWSDVDTLMIVKKEVIKNPKDLVNLRKHGIMSQKFFYRIDPHQLHGHFVISEFDLDYYPETYFPLILFKYSKSFFDDNRQIFFKIRECGNEKACVFWNDVIIYFLGKALNDYSYGRYAMVHRDKKLFLHRLLTFPLFYLQAKGHFTYKKNSFEEAKSDFAEHLWDVINIATSVRKEWKYKYRLNRHLRIISDINPKLFLLLLNKYYDFKYCSVDGEFHNFDKNYGRWLPQAVNLAIEGWNKLMGEGIT